MLENLSALVYLSKETVPFKEAEIQSLAYLSAKNNAEQQISGYLCYKEGMFVQYLEGKQLELNELMYRIRNDRRHHILEEVALGDIAGRHFQGWDMRYLDYQELNDLSLASALDWIIDGLHQQKMPIEVTQNIRRMIQDIRNLRDKKLIT